MREHFLTKCFFSLSEFSFDGVFRQEETVDQVLNRLPSLELFSIVGKIAISVPDNVTLSNSSYISIEEGTIIGPYTCIEGPCIIGKNCRIGHGAYIRPYTILSDFSVVGHGSEVKSSLFFMGAKAPHFCYVGDSILGARVNLGAGTKCANVRFDRKPIILRMDHFSLPTQRNKLGCILGDEAQTGCNVVLQPGTIVRQGGVVC